MLFRKQKRFQERFLKKDPSVFMDANHEPNHLKQKVLLKLAALLVPASTIFFVIVMTKACLVIENILAFCIPNVKV